MPRVQHRRGDAGDSANTVLAAVFVLVALFLIALFLIIGGGTTDRPVPDLRGDGVGDAAVRADAVGFDNVRAHDSWGRDRQVKERGWKVCYQTPDPRPDPETGKLRAYSTSTTVRLGAVLTTERCPNDYVLASGEQQSDQGLRGPLGDTMPDLVPNRTAYMVREIFGEETSIRFEKFGVTDRDEFLLTSDFGDWKACWQEPGPGAPYSGEPLRIVVRPYLEICQDSDGPVLPEYIGDEPPDELED